MISVRACAAFFRETRTRYSAPSVAAVGRLARRVGVGDDGRDRDGRAVNDNLAEHVHFRKLVSPVPPLPIYYALYIYIYHFIRNGSQTRGGNVAEKTNITVLMDCTRSPFVSFTATILHRLADRQNYNIPTQTRNDGFL